MPSVWQVRRKNRVLTSYMQSKRVPYTMHPHFLQGSLSPTGTNYRNMRGLLLLTLGESQGFHSEYGAGFIHSVDFVTNAFIHSLLHSVPTWLSVSQFHIDTLSFSLTSFPPSSPAISFATPYSLRHTSFKAVAL